MYNVNTLLNRHKQTRLDKSNLEAEEFDKNLVSPPIAEC